jgi:hypothetical protein
MHRVITRSLIALAAAAQLVGCATPAQNTRLEGTVVVDRMHDLHHGAPIRVAFRATNPEEPCAQAACRAWKPVERCTVGVERDVKHLEVVLGTYSHDFSACTGALPANHVIDVLAFIDLNDDGELGDGEPHAVRTFEGAAPKTAAVELHINRL